MDGRIQKPRINEIELQKYRNRHLLYLDHACFDILDKLIKNEVETLLSDEVLSITALRRFHKLADGCYLFYDPRECTFTVTDYGREMHKQIKSEVYMHHSDLRKDSTIDLMIERRKHLYGKHFKKGSRRRSDWDEARVTTTRNRILRAIKKRWQCVSQISSLSDVSYPTTQKYIKIFEKEGLVELDRPNPRMTLVRLANLPEGASEIRK